MCPYRQEEDQAVRTRLEEFQTVGGDRMVGPLGVVVSSFWPTSRIEGRGPHHHHVKAARRWCRKLFLQYRPPSSLVSTSTHSDWHPLTFNPTPKFLGVTFDRTLSPSLLVLTSNQSLRTKFFPPSPTL